MDRHTSGLAAIAVVLLTSALSGCEGCAADRRAEAQGLDGGVRIRIVPAPIGGGPARCFLRAQRRTRLLDDQAFVLCQGAPSEGPSMCFEASGRQALGFTDGQRIVLCRCSPDTEPLECVRLLQRETWLIDSQIIQLCSPSISGGLLANCRPVGS